MSQVLAHSNKKSIHSWDRFSYQEEEIYLALCNAPLTPTWPIFLEMVRERFDSPEQVETIELGSGYGKFSLCANLTGFPRPPSCRQESFPSLEDISSALSQATPLQTCFLSRHFSYMVALVGEK